MPENEECRPRAAGLGQGETLRFRFHISRAMICLINSHRCNEKISRRSPLQVFPVCLSSIGRVVGSRKRPHLDQASPFGRASVHAQGTSNGVGEALAQAMLCIRSAAQGKRSTRRGWPLEQLVDATMRPPEEDGHSHHTLRKRVDKGRIPKECRQNDLARRRGHKIMVEYASAALPVSMRMANFGATAGRRLPRRPRARRCPAGEKGPRHGCDEAAVVLSPALEHRGARRRSR